MPNHATSSLEFVRKICPVLLGCLLMLLTALPAAAQKTQSLLLIPFAVNAEPGNASQLRQDLPALLNRQLGNMGFRVLSQADAARVTGGAATQDPDRARRMGESLRADFVAYGTFNQIGNAFSLDLRLVDVKTGQMRPYHVERPTLVELSAAVYDLATQAWAGATSKNIITDIEIRGLRVLDPNRILIRLVSRVGDPINMERIDTDMRKIWEMGYFTDVDAALGHGPLGDILIFTVAEKPRIENIRIEGSNAVKLGDITEAMMSRTGAVLNEAVLVDDLAKVLDLYHQKGYYLAKINYEIQPKADGSSASLVLQVTEGNKLFIKEIAFDGLNNVSRSDLEGFMSLKRRGLFSWFTGTGVLKEDMLERDTQAIQAYMVNEGYIDAQVAAPEILYEEDGIKIVFRVREGDRYKLGNIGFSGDLIDTTEALYKLIKLDELSAKNSYFSLEVLQKDMRALNDFYTDKGYAFAHVGVDTNNRKGEAIVDITFILTPREMVFVRRIEVTGNDKTRDNVILREMRLADGQQFNGAALRRSVVRLDQLRYFDSVEPKLIPTGSPGEIDLEINVTEGKTGMVNVGFGYSTYDKFGVSAGIRESNLWGRGYQIGLNGYVSANETNMVASFVNPRLYNTNLGLGLSLYGIDEEWSSFDKRTLGGTIRLSYPLGEYTQISSGYRLDFYRLDNFSPTAPPSILRYAGNNWASVVSLGVERNTTNSANNPTSGTKASINVEYGGSFLGGDDNFVKPVADWGFYFGLIENHILHARATVGAVFRNTNSKPVPAFERFYPGGMNSIRGYSIDDLSPRHPRTGESIGANRLGFGSLEYIWNFQSGLGMALVPFFDIGVVTDAGQNSFFDKYYYSAGLELRWHSPMGDLRFAYGFPLTENVLGEKRSSGRFEFAMGQAF